MSISVSKECTVDVDVDIHVADLSKEEIGEVLAEAARRGLAPANVTGDGDAARAQTIIERAYLAARRLPEVPIEIADLFYHIHGRALA